LGCNSVVESLLTNEGSPSLVSLVLLEPRIDPRSDIMLSVGRRWLRMGLRVGPHAATIPTWTSTRFQIERPVRMTDCELTS
jgi:hypothetical protein